MATHDELLVRLVEAQLALVDRWTEIQKINPRAVRQWPQVFALLADDPNGVSLTRVAELQIRWRDAVLANSIRGREASPAMRKLMPITPAERRIVREGEVRARLMRDIFAAVARALCSQRLRAQMAEQKFSVSWSLYEKDLRIMKDEVAEVRNSLTARRAQGEGDEDEDVDFDASLLAPMYLWFLRQFVPGGEDRVPVAPTPGDVLRLDPDQYIHLPTKVVTPHDEMRSTADLRAILRMLESTYAGPAIPRPDLHKLLAIDREYVERQGRHVGSATADDDECWPATIERWLARTPVKDLPTRVEFERELDECGITGDARKKLMVALLANRMQEQLARLPRRKP